MRPGYTYIMTNKWNTVLYTGCTSDIVKRVKEHKQHKYKGSFTDKYNCEKCVYYEVLPDYISAIHRENRIKNMRRAEKIALINSANPEWRELVAENGASSAPPPAPTGDGATDRAPPSQALEPY